MWKNLEPFVQTKDGSHFDFLPDLPETSYGHCLTIIDETRFLVAGGGLSSVYIYDGNEAEWNDVGVLPNGIGSYPACGVIKDQDNGQALKVVIAGGLFGSDDYGVDIYNLERNEWQDAGLHMKFTN